MWMQPRSLNLYQRFVEVPWLRLVLAWAVYSPWSIIQMVWADTPIIHIYSFFRETAQYGNIIIKKGIVSAPEKWCFDLDWEKDFWTILALKSSVVLKCFIKYRNLCLNSKEDTGECRVGCFAWDGEIVGEKNIFKTGLDETIGWIE